jgi:hypothetical protein
VIGFGTLQPGDQQSATKHFAEDLPFSTAVVTEEGDVTHAETTTSAAEVFGLPEDWPLGEKDG